ncbi:N-acetylmuramoyl-L-alanine amidase [Streptomyces sp. NPDC000410]|uniref:peptidoglycan recognition protein family protein n=1 Tax=Streptomyces sp. NPDC000410 TaxID=3154254 RepID=UPI00331D9501
MRAFFAASFASCIGVACTAALALPPTPTQAFTTAVPAEPDLPGSTQSLPLAPLTGLDRAPGGAVAQGLPRRDVRPFSLVGVVWDDVDTELHGTVQVRTRATGSKEWSAWQDLVTHNHEHAPDPDSPERAEGTVRGSTAPLWVGDSDGVEVRVRPETADGPRGATPPLPGGLRLELVDPGKATEPDAPRSAAPASVREPATNPQPGEEEATQASGPKAGGATELDLAAAPLTAEAAAASAVNAELAPLGATEIPAQSKAETMAEAGLYGVARPYIGPRPGIITRKGWGANEALREKQFVYTHAVKAAFVHHSATGNRYTCAQAPSVLRSIYRYHVESSGWRDIGYNFAVDKCGNIYEGRAGGVAKAVLGAHTLGFNTNSMGIAVLGTYSATSPPAAVVDAVAKLTAWKLGLYGVNPQAKASLISGGGNKFKKGTTVKLNAISGHRDGFATECPGGLLYNKLGAARSTSAKLQGR